MEKFNFTLSHAVNAENGIGMTTIIKGVILSYVITIIVFLVFAFFITYSNFSESTIPAIVIVTTMISLIIGGTKVSKQARSKGWLNGAIVGGTYMIILYVMSCLQANKITFDSYVAYMFILGLLAGAIGGIIGINLKGKKRKI